MNATHAPSHRVRARRLLAWRPRRWPVLGAVGILVLAATLRLWALDRPDQLVFDEIYYVRDAFTQLLHGFPTTWPTSDPQFGGTAARAFSEHAASVAHPPLGKWLIGLGMLLFGLDGAGVDTGWGWRIAAATAGIATVALTMRLGWLLTRSTLVACFAGLILAVDGVHIVLSRVALLDGFLTVFVVIGAIFAWRVHERTYSERRCGERRLSRAAQSLGPILWRRPWLLAAGAAFGAAAAVKWSGLYPLAAFLILITVRDVMFRWRIPTRRTLSAALQAIVSAGIALSAALATYLASWVGWIVTSGGQYRESGTAWWVSLWRWHVHAFEWHSTLDADHPYRSHPLSWPLGLRPTGMYWARVDEGNACEWSGGCVAAISALPNLLVTWGGVAALGILVWGLIAALRRLRAPGRVSDAVQARWVWAVAFVLTGYLSGWLPWVLTISRSAVFQFYTVVLTPFAALALALTLAALCSRGSVVATALGLRLNSSAQALQGRRVAVVVFLVFAVSVAILFFPVWSGMPVAEWFWRAHLWLPGWR